MGMTVIVYVVVGLGVLALLAFVKFIVVYVFVGDDVGADVVMVDKVVPVDKILVEVEGVDGEVSEDDAIFVDVVWVEKFVSVGVVLLANVVVAMASVSVEGSSVILVVVSEAIVVTVDDVMEFDPLEENIDVVISVFTDVGVSSVVSVITGSIKHSMGGHGHL